MIEAAQDTALPRAHPVDISTDPTGYRDRVYRAVDEIRDRRYQWE